jgi:hypothetical protein
MVPEHYIQMERRPIKHETFKGVGCYARME